ncbi:DUF1559 domain-containing protein [Tundrisphaera sp. TA3]|uniref:DUF1559 family PulG-like putative transporter n=1 Tax=Tundrisphaera sp. TA3 TaxID=3435775 RepID=UPI003EBFB5A6
MLKALLPDTPYNSSVGSGVWKQQFSSYAANEGTFNCSWVEKYRLDPAKVAQYTQLNGVIYGDSAVRITDVTDGTSNTMIFGEHTVSGLQRINAAYAYSDFAWNTGQHYDTLFVTMFPPNAYTGSRSGLATTSTNYPNVASSQHPGGANFAFCDGSVRFIKSTIDSWAFNGNYPVGVTYSNFVYTIAPGTKLGVYQALSTRAFGEITSADAF